MGQHCSNLNSRGTVQAALSILAILKSTRMSPTVANPQQLELSTALAKQNLGILMMQQLGLQQTHLK
jgi:hypothetical protein